MMKFDSRILTYLVRKLRKIRKIKIRKRVEKCI